MKLLVGRILLVLWALAISLVILELSAFSFFLRNRRHYLFREAREYVLKPSDLERLAPLYDKELGWKIRRSTPFGERPTARTYGNPIAVAFGDSFVYGEESSDADAWPIRLAGLLGRDVLNFGVGGYGVDQAVLSYVSKTKLPRVQYAVLGMIAGDMNRNMTVYRNFLRTFEGGVPLTKPRFDVVAGRIVEIPNPIADAAALSNLKDEAFVRTLETKDWWRTKYDYPSFSFPFTRIFLAPSFWRQVRNELDLSPWDDADALAVLRFLFQKFAETARARGEIPVIALLPDQTLLELRKTQPARAERIVERFHEACRASQSVCGDPGALFGADFASLFTGPTDGAHYAPAGNERVASYFYDLLRGQGGTR